MDIAMGILLAAVIAGAASGGVLVVLARPWRAGSPGWLASAASAIAVGVGCFAGHVYAQGWPEVPPGDATDWIPWIAVGGGVWFAVVRPPARTWTELLLLPPAFAATWLLERNLKPGQAGEWIMYGCAGFLLSQLPVRRTASFWSGSHLASSALVTSAAASACLLLSGSVKLAEEAGALSGAVAGAAGVCILFPRGSFASGHLTCLLVLVSVLLAGGLYSELPGWSAVLLVASAASPGVANCYWVDEHSPRWRLRAAFATAILFALAAAVIARLGSAQV